MKKKGVMVPRAVRICLSCILHCSREITQCANFYCCAEIVKEIVNSRLVMQLVYTPTRWSFWHQWKIPEIKQEWEVCEWLQRISVCKTAGDIFLTFKKKRGWTEKAQPPWVSHCSCPTEGFALWWEVGVVCLQFANHKLKKRENSSVNSCWGWHVVTETVHSCY